MSVILKKNAPCLLLLAGLGFLLLEQSATGADKPTASQAATLQKAVDAAKARLNAARTSLATARAQAKQAQAALTKAASNMASAQAAVKAAEDKLAKHREAIRKAAEAKAAALKKEAAAAKAARDAAAKSLQQAQSRAAATRQRIAKQQQEIAQAKAAIAAAEKSLKTQQAAVAKATAAQAAADKLAAAAAKSAAAAAAKAKAAADKAAAAKKAALAAAAVVNKTRQSIAADQQQIATVTVSVKKATGVLTSLKPEIDKSQAALAAAEKTLLEKQRAAEAALQSVGQFVSFSRDIAPIFAQRCLACHNARIAKGRLNMETFAGILKGSESGAIIEAGDADSSTLYAMIDDDSMPKDADPLTKVQKSLIKKWIRLGATLNAGITPADKLTVIMPRLPQPPPPSTYRVAIPVTALAYNADGTQLASSGYHEVILWSAADGRLLRRITNVAERVYDITYSPDGKTIAVAAGTPAQTGEVKLFSAADGKMLADLVRSDDSIFAVAFSPDGKRLACGGADRGIRVFDVATGKRQLLIEDHADWVMDVAWSPDGKKLATASRDKTSKLFDMKTGESLLTFNGHGQPVFGVGFTPNGKQVVTSGRDKQIRIWDAKTAKQVRAIGGFGNEVFRIAVTKDGRVFSCSADRTVRVHTLANGKLIRTFKGLTDWVYSVAYSRATKQIAGGAYNGQIRTWNVADGKARLTFTAAPGYKRPTATASVKK